MSMKKIFILMIWAAAAIAVSSCRQEVALPGETDGAEGGGGPEIVLTVGNDFTTAGRSAVTSSENVQHIEHIYAYVFRGTQAGATLIHAQDLEWEPKKVIDSPFRTNLKGIKLYSETPQDYTVLVIGTDNNSDTYDFPYPGQTDPLAVDGTKTLGEALLSLSAGKTAGDMRFTEVFAGMQTFSSADAVIEVGMQRCVAGVLCYLKDIPEIVSGNRVTGIRLVMRNEGNDLQLNNRLPLGTGSFGQDAGSGLMTWDEDTYGSASGGSAGSILAETDLYEEWGAQASGDTDDKSTLYIPARNDGSVSTLEGSVLISAYLLPMEKGRLGIQLMGRDEDDEDAPAQPLDGYFYPVSMGDGDSDETNADGTYRLRANHIYSIGTKKFSDNTDSDQPASLLGGALTVDPQPWTSVMDEIMFPVVSLTATMQFLNPFNQDRFIFNCIGTDEEVIRINADPYDDGSGDRVWTLRVDYGDEEEKDWIHFKDGDKIVSEIVNRTGSTGTGNVPNIPVIINDFVRKRTGLINNQDSIQRDYRTAYIVLTQQGLEGLPFKIRVRQYNAITIGDYGYSRLDYNDEFDRETGEPNMSGTQAAWGLQRSDYISYDLIYGISKSEYESNRNGYYLVSKAFQSWYTTTTGYWVSRYNTDYKGSALFFTMKDAIEYTADGTMDSRVAPLNYTSGHDEELGKMPPEYDHMWFLPTETELSSLFAYDNKVLNLHLNEWYWSSATSGNENTNYYTWAVKKVEPHEANQSGTATQTFDRKLNINEQPKHYFRQARKILE